MNNRCHGLDLPLTLAVFAPACLSIMEQLEAKSWSKETTAKEGDGIAPYFLLSQRIRIRRLGGSRSFASEAIEVGATILIGSGSGAC
jgi:hypothetical protein